MVKMDVLFNIDLFLAVLLASFKVFGASWFREWYVKEIINVRWPYDIYCFFY